MPDLRRMISPRQATALALVVGCAAGAAITFVLTSRSRRALEMESRLGIATADLTMPGERAMLSVAFVGLPGCKAGFADQIDELRVVYPKLRLLLTLEPLG